MLGRVQGPGLTGALVAALLLVAAGLVSTSSASAQAVKLPSTGGAPTPVLPMPSLPMPGTGPTSPTLTPSLTPSVIPTLPPAVAVPQVAAPVPAARVVRFRCELAPQDQSCREPGVGDGGGDDGECNCARDYCYTSRAGIRVCERLQ